VPSITMHGMTALVTSTINVARAAMTNLAACVTGAGESNVGNHDALRALWASIGSVPSVVIKGESASSPWFS
jgi:hypothetical protein